VAVECHDPRAGAQSEAVALLETLVDEDETDLYDQFVSKEELKALFRSARDAAELIDVARNLGRHLDGDVDQD
jgi:hypothetical protein